MNGARDEGEGVLWELKQSIPSSISLLFAVTFVENLWRGAPQLYMPIQLDACLILPLSTSPNSSVGLMPPSVCPLALFFQLP